MAIVTDDTTTREELLEAIEHHNAAAKQLSRRGRMGMESPVYAALHACLNDAITDLEMWG